jgi:hypothetical protein
MQHQRQEITQLVVKVDQRLLAHSGLCMVASRERANGPTFDCIARTRGAANTTIGRLRPDDRDGSARIPRRKAGWKSGASAK